MYQNAIAGSYLVFVAEPDGCRILCRSTVWERSGSVVKCVTRDRLRASPASLCCVIKREH